MLGGDSIWGFCQEECGVCGWDLFRLSLLIIKKNSGDLSASSGKGGSDTCYIPTLISPSFIID